MKDTLEDATKSTDNSIVIALFIILNLFLFWLWRFPLIRQAIGIKIISLFFTVIFFFVIILEFVLLHKIFLMFLGQKSQISLNYKHLIGIIVVIFFIILIMVNLMTYSYGVSILLCDKEDKPVDDCSLIDYSAVYPEYQDILKCDDIYEEGKGKLNSIFGFLKFKSGSCFLGKVFKI
jgi:hypothetical protein